MVEVTYPGTTMLMVLLTGLTTFVVFRHKRFTYYKSVMLIAVTISVLEGKKKILVTLQCFKASLYSLFLIASLALFRAVFTSLLDILSKQKACLYLNKGKGLFKRTIYKFQPEWNYNDTCLTVTVPTNWTNLTSEKGTHNSFHMQHSFPLK